MAGGGDAAASAMAGPGSANHPFPACRHPSGGDGGLMAGCGFRHLEAADPPGVIYAADGVETEIYEA